MHRSRRIKHRRKKNKKPLHPVTLFFACFACSFLFVLFVGNETGEYSLENLRLKDFIKVPGKEIQKTEKMKMTGLLAEKISQNN